MLRVPRPEPRWQAPLWPFTEETWLALAVGFLLSGPVLNCLAHYSAQSLHKASYLESLTSSYLHVTAMHLREPVAPEPNTNTSRVMVVFLWLYGMVLEVSYCSNLTAFLTVTRQPRTIDTFQAFQDSDLGIVGLGPLFGSLMDHSVNKYLKELSKRFISLSSDPESWVTDGRAGYISSRQYLKYTMAKINSEHRAPFVRVMKECAWPFSVSVALQSYSPLKPRIDEVVTRIAESGLVSYWFEESTRTATQNRRKPQRQTTERKEETSDRGRVMALSIDHMQGVFYILTICYLSTILLFLAELTVGRWEERNTRN